MSDSVNVMGVDGYMDTRVSCSFVWYMIQLVRR